MNPMRPGRTAASLLLVGLGLIVILGGCRAAQTQTPISPLTAESPLEVPDIGFAVEPGGLVLFHRQEESGLIDIYILDLETGDMTRLTEGKGNDFDPVWSPDGSRIAFVSDREQQPPYCTLWLMNADGSDPRSLLDPGDYFDLGPTWSPDMTRIAFQSNREGNPDIFILNLESGELTNLTRHPNVDANPAWSPDGTQIAFASDRSGNPEIWLINVDGGGLRQITERPMVGDWRPAWSPDGQRLIFESYPSIAPRRLYIQGLNEQQAREIRTLSVWNMWPDWVTDDLVLYAASEEYNDDVHRGSPANLYLQNLRTGEVHQLTSGPGNDGRPTWSP